MSKREIVDCDACGKVVRDAPHEVCLAFFVGCEMKTLCLNTTGDTVDLCLSCHNRINNAIHTACVAIQLRYPK